MNSPSNFSFLSKSDKKLAILIDPDKHSEESLIDFAKDVLALNPDILLLGSSLIVNSSVENAARIIKSVTHLPLILFPGHFTQLNKEVDGVLLLSLISGRNADLLIGQHVLAAPILSQLNIDIYSTGYMLIDGGKPTSVSYISNTQPIPNDKFDIAVCTAQAAQFIGMKYIYLDAGSGAKITVSSNMVKAVSGNVDLPIIVGGGIKTLSKIDELWEAGANLVVIGNALEEDSPSLLKETRLAQKK